MATFLKSKSLYYNDVNLIAQPSQVNSRSEIPNEINRIIVSPMEAIVGKTFAKEADRLGLSICLHRFCPPERQLDIFNELENKHRVFVSVGLHDIDRVKLLYNNGASNFLLDIANGYIKDIRPALYEIQAHAPKLINLMVGNVMTGTGFYNSTICTANTYVRVGIAGGSACSTSDATGYNRGQITEILEVKETKNTMGNANNKHHYIVADGGIKNGNYAAKAFGAGADYIMIGGLFGRAKEAETHIIGDGTYWGGASNNNKKDMVVLKNIVKEKSIKLIIVLYL